MGLRHLTSRLETVVLSDGESFTVRGLDLIDIIKLAEIHREQLGSLFTKATDGGFELALSDKTALIGSVFAIAPAVAVEIIGMGADESNLTLVRLLPIDAQIDALEKIAAATFRSSSPKKILETVIRVMNGLTGTMSLPA